MGFFECCHHCPSDKRHPGCHATCKDYKDAKELHDSAMEAERKKHIVPPAKTDYYNKSVWYNYKRR